MSPRVIGLAALCAALGLALLVEPERPSAEVLSYQLPAFSTVTAFEVHRTGQPTVRLNRTAEGWRVAPEGQPADAHALAKIEAVLAEPLGVDQRSERGADDSRFGLGEHALRVVLHHASGVFEVTIGKVVDGRRTFIRPSQDSSGVVYRAKGNLRRLFDRPAHTWRERRLFAHRLEDVASLERLDGSQTSWRLSRGGSGAPWVLNDAQLPVAQEAAHAVINSLITTKVDRFEARDTPFEPRFTLRARSFSGQEFGIQLSGQPGAPHLIRALKGGSVARLPAWFVPFLDVHRTDLREARLLMVEPQQVQGLLIQRANGLSLRRLENGIWRSTTPSEGALDPKKIERYLQQLSGLRANGFVQAVPAGAFNTRWGSVELRVAGDRVLRVEIGAEFGNGAHFVRVDQARATGAVLNPATLGWLFPSLEDLR